MNIGIIGAGNIGSVLAGHFRKLQHTVKIANSRGPETLSHVAQETGAKPATLLEAASGVDLLVITIPMKSVPSLPNDLLAKLPATSPIIDTGNYYPLRDGVISEIKDGVVESEWTSRIWVVVSSKRSTTSRRTAFFTKLSQKDRRSASPFRYQEMTSRQSKVWWLSWIRSASTPSMQALSPNPGAFSLGRRRTAQIQRSRNYDPCCSEPTGTKPLQVEIRRQR